MSDLHTALDEPLYKNAEARLLPGPLHPRCPEHPDDTWQAPMDKWRFCGHSGCKWSWSWSMEQAAARVLADGDNITYVNDRAAEMRYQSLPSIKDPTEWDKIPLPKADLSETTIDAGLSALKVFMDANLKLLEHAPKQREAEAALQADLQTYLDKCARDPLPTLLSGESWQKVFLKDGEVVTEPIDVGRVRDAIYHEGLKLLRGFGEVQPEPDILAVTRDVARGG